MQQSLLLALWKENLWVHYEDSRLIILCFWFAIAYSYEHFDRGRSNCPMFRDEDYYAPRDEEEPKEAASATDDLGVLETALFSVCPRCGEVSTKIYYIALPQ